MSQDYDAYVDQEVQDLNEEWCKVDSFYDGENEDPLD